MRKASESTRSKLPLVGAPITLPVNILAIISAGLLELIQGLRRRQVSNNSDVAPSGVVSSDFPSRHRDDKLTVLCEPRTNDPGSVGLGGEALSAAHRIARS